MRCLVLLATACAGALACAAPAVAAPNAPPVNTVPGTQMIAEDTTVAFSGGNAISIADPDADPDDLRVTLNAAFGRMTLATTSGLSFFGGAGGDNNGLADTETRIQGTLAELNAALDGMTFTPSAHHNDDFGTATLTILTDDQGNNGDDGGKTDTDVITINVSAVPEPPQVSVPAGVGTFRDVARVLSLANLNSLTVDEPDDDDPVNIGMELSTTDGTLTLASTAGLTPTGGANGSASMSFTGTDATFTGALNAGLTFTPEPGFTGAATITADATDLDGSDAFVTDIRVDEPGDMVFWTAAKETSNPPFVPVTIPGALGRAFLDGSGGVNLVTGPELNDTPAGVAIDAVEGRIFWANTGAISPTEQGIWSANLDGTDKQVFLTKAQAVTAGATLDIAFNLAVDQESRRIYWANSSGTALNRGISYVSLDDITTGGRVSTGAAKVTSPRGLALDLEHDRVYWTNWSGSAANQSVSYAPLPGESGTAGDFTISGSGLNQASGVALDLAGDPERLFWTNGAGTAGVDEAERLRVAELAEPFSSSIMGAPFDISPNPGGGMRTPAIDPAADRIYWANSSSDDISYAGLDGDGGGGADLLLGTAFTNSPDGVTILRAPEPVSPPSVTGTPAVGSVLTCTAGAWAPDQPNHALYRVPASTAFAWTRDGVEIPGATGSTHAPAAGGEYRCLQRATNFAGTSTQQASAVTVPAAPASADDAVCNRLEKRLAKLTRSLARSSDAKKRAKLRTQRRATKRKMRKRGC